MKNKEEKRRIKDLKRDLKMSREELYMNKMVKFTITIITNQPDGSRFKEHYPITNIEEIGGSKLRITSIEGLIRDIEYKDVNYISDIVIIKEG